MPTGYTHNIENGISFEDFALYCARAFGACVHQRDDVTTDKPKLREETSYYAEKLPEALAELGYLQSLDSEQQEEFGTNARDEEITRIQEQLEKKRELEAKYRAMLDKVGQWTPPTPDHNGLKDFMTKQIVDSIQFDCTTNYYVEELQKAISMRPIDFYNQAVSKAEWSCSYYEEELEKEEKRVAESNAWIIELYKSLGISYE